MSMLTSKTRMWIPLSPQGKDVDNNHEREVEEEASTLDLAPNSPHQHTKRRLGDLVQSLEATGWYTEFVPFESFCSYGSPYPSEGSLSNFVKVSYPLLNSSRQSILFAQESKYHSSILVLQLENGYKVFVVDHCIQYVRCTSNPVDNSILLTNSWNRHLALSEMVTHIPLCSVVPEPSYVLILNTRPCCLRRNDTLLLGYSILKQLLQCYQSTLYRVVFVEEDPMILQVWKEFWDEALFEDACVEVVHANPRAYLQDSAPGRYQVVFATNGFIESESLTETSIDPWAMVQQALVPGGVACTLVSDPISHSFESTTDHSCAIEYARLPSVYHTRLLRLHIRETTSAHPTCQVSFRQPVLPHDVQLQEYSAATHRSAFILPPCLQRYQSKCYNSNDICTTPDDGGTQPPGPPYFPENNHGGRDAERNGPRYQHFPCLDHDKIESLMRTFHITLKVDAVTPLEEVSQEDGAVEMERRHAARSATECFSLVPTLSCVIQ